MRRNADHAYDRIAASPARQKELEGLVQEVARHRITRRHFLERAAVLGLGASGIATILAACGSDEEQSADQPVSIDTTVKPEKITFYNWADYLAPANKEKFEQQTGIKIEETYFDNLDAVITKLKSGSADYDLLPPAGWALPILYKAGLLQPLEMSLIPNFANVMARFQTVDFDDPDENDGKKYSVPYQWGSVGIAYRLDKVSPAPTSWTSLFSPAADPFAGQLTMLDDSRETPGAVLKMLGYSLNTTDQAELDEAIDKLIEQKPIVSQYDNANCKRNLVSGTPLVHTWDGTTRQAMTEGGTDKIGYALPTEGYSLWVDNLAVPAAAPSAYGAHLFMDFMLDPQNQADLIDYTQYLSPVEEAFAILGDDILSGGVPSEEELSDGEFLMDLGEFTRNYTDGWRKVKSA